MTDCKVSDGDQGPLVACRALFCDINTKLLVMVCIIY